ncbi:LicD family protein [Lactiplantibacillus plantarum]|uniref:LicD family protein n=1 Tax=Lactiplantibacillus plantarum TaxID=1590 RepID=UPI0028FC20CB|nr:LicD family protein [Lactiplantibacillus plantarum]WNW16753.1 LicD family protein [Lactiplantibacillus plantarum]WNW20220.1 LicD family protein [Lactiplantibacillus plantarum]
MVNLREEMYAGLDQIQDKEFDVFTALLNIFNKNKLRYFVTGGTVLGANFYQNFIPYDDDIDVALVREDYNKFIEILYHELPEEYRVQHYTLNSDFKYTIVRVENTSIDITEVSDPDQKISHPSIDIAPLDGTPSGNISRKFFFARLLILRGVLTGCYANSINMNKDRSVKDKVLIHSLKIGGRIFKLIVNPTKVKQRIDKILSRHSFDSSPLIGTYMGAYRSKG